MTQTALGFAAAVRAAVGAGAILPGALTFTGEGALPSAFAVTDLAAGTLGAAALGIADLLGAAPVTVDRRLAAFWFSNAIRPQGWELPPAWDAIAGDYRTRDGWVRLHTNAPHHRAAALRVLGLPEDRAAVTQAVAAWRGGALETVIVDAGGCAAQMRSAEEWAAHPQGRAVAAEPLVHWEPMPSATRTAWRPRADRPLAGLRVLDLTRVLAGPAAGRFLAGYGAEVLRIDPPGWEEPSLAPEMTLGKACARLDLHDAADRRTFEALLCGTDILLHGYRPAALERLGYGTDARRALAPGLIDVSLCAYGWTGPWAGRRGFDSLVQMSTGIAEAGMGWKGAGRPTPLPVQALDHATGYMMAAAALAGVKLRLTEGRGVRARLSLARTAALLVQAGAAPAEPAHAAETADDLAPGVESTAWGKARRLRPPVDVAGAPMAWDRPATELGSAAAAWR